MSEQMWLDPPIKDGFLKQFIFRLQCEIRKHHRYEDDRYLPLLYRCRCGSLLLRQGKWEVRIIKGILKIKAIEDE